YEITNNKYERIFNLKDNQKYKWVIRDNILFIYGISIYSFIEFITSIRIRCNIWFHNGSKFDFHFIIPMLMEFGYLYIPDFNNMEDFLKENDRLKTRHNILSDKVEKLNKKVWNTLNAYEFNTMTDGSKKIYKLQLVSREQHYNYEKQKYNNVLINLRDSNLLFVGSLKSYGDKLNQIHNTTKYTKKELDYMREQPYNSIEELEQDTQEFEYLLQDTFILLSFLKEMGSKKELPRNQWHTTAAATAYSQWERQFGEKYFKEHIKTKKNIKENKNKYKLYWSEISQKWLEEHKWKKEVVKSILPLKWLNIFLDDKNELMGTYLHRLFYNGGITLVNEKYRGTYLENVDGFDINSSYPSVMNSNDLCPIGEPFNKQEIDFNYYQLFEIEILKPITNKNGLPFFVNFNNGEKIKKSKQYLKELKPKMKSYMDTNEFKRFLKYYSNDFSNFKVNVFATFNVKTMKDIFGDYVDKWYSLKQNSNDELSKTIAKLMLNSTYGKFGTKILRDKKEFDMKICDWVNFETLENARFYLPIATCITSLARCKII
ncbi:MAG: hypothetical protein E7Y34_01875, partial [Mycoplasma sp.]|nr:hypothetical protein [Mycoplasma sp.]